MTDTAKTGGFFQTMGWIMMLLVISGFGIVQVLTPELTSPMRPTLALHIVTLLAWFALLIVQPRLIAKRNFALHKQIGQLSMALAIALVVVGLIVTHEAYLSPGWSIAGMIPQSSVMFPFTDMIFFSVLYWIAFAKRTEAHTHKRLMLFAGIIMLDPALARLFRTLEMPPPLLSAVEIGLVLAIAIHDRRTLGRVHGATWFGLALVLATYPLVFGVSQTGAWTGMVTSLLGSPPVS